MRTLSFPAQLGAIALSTLGALPANAEEVKATAPPAGEDAPSRLDRCRTTAPEPRGNPPGATVRAGRRTSYTPFFRFGFGRRCMMLELPASVAARVDGASSFPVDRYGSTFTPGAAVSPYLRIGARFSTGMELKPLHVLAEYEHDLVIGTFAGSGGVAGEGMPFDVPASTQLRKLHARLALANVLQLDVGVNTSHFGMGLLANDGDHGWTPGSARFSDPRSGDRVLRAQLSTGPHSELGVVLAGGVDRVVGDDTMLDGDSARQVFGALLLGVDRATSGGLYMVRRHLENRDGRATDVSVFDITGRTKVAFPGGVFAFETEWALISGTTAFAPTPEFVEQQVLQVGGAVRASVDTGKYGAVIDFLFATGDQNPNDGKLSSFRADPNYEMGLLLFRQVMAAQTGRTAITAADPTLVGVPIQDLERVPSRGSPTNTIAVFPRLRYRPMAGFEAYGGPLFAFASTANADVFNTQVAGGAPRSALDGPAGRYLGTELDLGVRYQGLIYGSELTLGGEVGVLAPGNAFIDATGKGMGPVTGGRAMLRYRL